VFSAVASILKPKGTAVGTEAEERLWVEGLARRITAAGLADVVRSSLDLTRAVGFLGAQALLMAQPLAGSLLGEATLKRVLALLEDPHLQEHLLMSLESGGEGG